MIILDIGAGDGKRCVRWLDTWKDALVYAFEPDPRQYAKLEATYKSLKDKDRRRMKIFNAAVWRSNGEIDFHLCNDETSSSPLPFVTENIKKWKYPPGRYYFKTEGTIKVQSIRLDSICKSEKIDVIDFLRIDAQGCTNQILEGLGKDINHVKEIFVKVHTLDFDIYKGQSHREEFEPKLIDKFFIAVHAEPYSRQQEAWVRYESDVWKRTRGAKIYNLD